VLSAGWRGCGSSLFVFPPWGSKRSFNLSFLVSSSSAVSSLWWFAPITRRVRERQAALRVRTSRENGLSRSAGASFLSSQNTHKTHDTLRGGKGHHERRRGSRHARGGAMATHLHSPFAAPPPPPPTPHPPPPPHTPKEGHAHSSAQRARCQPRPHTPTRPHARTHAKWSPPPPFRRSPRTS
jgi:hypothetical protein